MFMLNSCVFVLFFSLTSWIFYIAYLMAKVEGRNERGNVLCCLSKDRPRNEK